MGNSEHAVNLSTRNRAISGGSLFALPLRWQSAAATPLFDGAQRCQSGVALRFPPQSQKFGCGYAALCLCVKIIYVGAMRPSEIGNGMSPP
jgi:hypothetical protein